MNGHFIYMIPPTRHERPKKRMDTSSSCVEESFPFPPRSSCFCCINVIVITYILWNFPFRCFFPLFLSFLNISPLSLIRANNFLLFPCFLAPFFLSFSFSFFFIFFFFSFSFSSASSSSFSSSSSSSSSFSSSSSSSSSSSFPSYSSTFF